MASNRPVLRYLTHPQVKIDPGVPVPEWGLSELGRRRTETFCSSPFLQRTKRIVSSPEAKAIETASILAARIGVELETCPSLHENDRSATGFLDGAEYEATVDQFFAEPETSIRGWERAIDAQARVVRAVEAVLARHRDGDLLIVGHGGVGTLSLCHYGKLPIDRAHDQPPGGGNLFAVTLDGFTVMHRWRAMEQR